MIRHIAPQNPDKYADELLDAYLSIDDADALYAEYAARGVEFTRSIADMPWHKREFVVKDCDGRLLAFGADPVWPASQCRTSMFGTPVAAWD